MAAASAWRRPTSTARRAAAATIGVTHERAARAPGNAAPGAVVLIPNDDLEQATIDAIHALGHLGLLAGANGQYRFEAAVEAALSVLVECVQIDLSRIGDVADALADARPGR